MTKSICLVTSGQPSANPRLVKEAIAFAKSGYLVTVIYCPLSPWADSFDEQLFQDYPNITWKKVGYHPKKQKWSYLYARLRQKAYHFLYKILGNLFDFAVKSCVLFSQELTKAATQSKAQLYIGHNLGALPAVVNAAKKNKAKAAFDFEDFHRGEAALTSLQSIKARQIEDKYAPYLSYATTAAPLITEAYQQLYPQVPFQTILNCFSSKMIKPLQKLPKNELRLFWFSQTIGKNRGIEDIIIAIGQLKNKKISLTLLGNVSLEVKEYLQALAAKNNCTKEQIIWLNPVSLDQIVAIAAYCHIGIASELPHILNRDLCLTNKIFIYLLAGNAILYSSTRAQVKFYKEYNSTGFLYLISQIEQIKEVLNMIIQNFDLLEDIRRANCVLAKNYLCWENEENKLLKIMESNLNN